MTPERKTELAQVLRTVWGQIAPDFANSISDFIDEDGERLDIDKMDPVEIAEVCADYVGIHGGTKADLNELVNLDEAAFAEIGRLAFGKEASR